eukprot:568543-Rhodomonas_salina.1
MLLNSPADLLQVPVKCRPCQSGQALTLDILNAGRTSTWRCTQCAQNQCCPTHALIAYIVDPKNANYKCEACPAGAICDGAEMISRVAGAEWE